MITINKIIKLIFLSLLIISCGPTAKIIAPPSDLKLDNNGTYNLSSSQDLSNEMRDITFIIKPNPEELTNFEFNFDASEDNKQYYDDVFKLNTNYSDKIHKVIKKDLELEKKLEKLTYLIYASGDVKLDKTQEVIILERKKNQAKNDFGLKEKLKPVFDKFPCFVVKIEGKKHCQLTNENGPTRPKIRKTRSCKDFSKRISKRGRGVKFNLSNMPQETINDYKASIKECKSLEKKYSKISEKFEKLIKPIKRTKDNSKAIVTNLLKSVDDSNTSEGQDSFDYIIANEPDNSELITDRNFTHIKTLSLKLSGLITAHVGMNDYSIENGLIQNASFGTNFDVRMLYFDIITDEIVIEASLSYSEHPILGGAFTGDIKLIYSNGITRKGIMKLEIDFAKTE